MWKKRAILGAVGLVGFTAKAIIAGVIATTAVKSITTAMQRGMDHAYMIGYTHGQLGTEPRMDRGKSPRGLDL
jgi:hypothetical protein